MNEGKGRGSKKMLRAKTRIETWGGCHVPTLCLHQLLERYDSLAIRQLTLFIPCTLQIPASITFGIVS